MKGRIVATSTLSVTFEGPGVDSGVPLDDLLRTLESVQDAVRMMVDHLSGGGSAERGGRPLNTMRRSDGLRLLLESSPRSLTAELAFAPLSEGLSDMDDEDMDDGDIASQALQAILCFNGDGSSNGDDSSSGDGFSNGDDSSCGDGFSNGEGFIPRAVVDLLRSVGAGLSPDVSSVWLGDSRDKRRVHIKRGKPLERSVIPFEAALVHGWLREIDRERRTAQLHDGTGKHIALRFEPALGDIMIQFAARYVKIVGKGRFDEQGGWAAVTVESIHAARSWETPFESPSVVIAAAETAFDPDEVITTDDPFDVEDFISTIHAGRDMNRI